MSKIKVVRPQKEKKPKEKREKKSVPKWILSAVIVVLISAVALAWALPALPVKPRTQPPSGYQGVIELWNVETFEGGSGSRSSWLTNKSAKFEKANSGLFVHVTDLTVTELADKLQNGQRFDLICFSRGVGSSVLEYLAPFNDSVGFVRDNFMISGQVDGKQYGVPLYAGAYCLFARSGQLSQDKLTTDALTATFTRKIGKNTVELRPLICGFTQANSPLTALAMSGLRGDASYIDEGVTQYQAYEQFVANNTAVTLLGTQRDIFRLGQKESQSKIDELGFAPVGEYTDLVQYVGISKDCEEKRQSCIEYVKYILSEETQAGLINLNMFSVLDKQLYSSNARMSACEQALSSAFVPNAFVNGEVIANQRQTAKSTLKI